MADATLMTICALQVLQQPLQMQQRLAATVQLQPLRQQVYNVHRHLAFLYCVATRIGLALSPSQLP